MKHKIIGIVICMLLISTTTTLNVALSNENVQPTIYKIINNFSQPIITNENEYYSIITNKANSFLLIQGKPLLPSYKETFTFPFGTKIKNVLVTPQNIQKLTLSKDIEPTPQRIVVGQNIRTTELGSTNYGMESYPSQWYDYRVGCGLYNGKLSIILTLEIYPIQYHPVEKTIHWAKEAAVIVEYEPTTGILQSTYQDDFDFIIIGPSDYIEEITPLISHKNERGITTKFVSLNEIYQGAYFPVTGRDDQEKIKYFIKNAIENWGTSNILLLGGHNVLPVRETHIYVSDTDSEIFVSDLYYADIYNETAGFSSWDTNENNIFGEYNWEAETDVVDLYPDVLLTRIPAISVDQVVTCVNKIIFYELYPGYQQPWFSTLVMVGGDTFEDDDKINEGEYANQNVRDIMTGFMPIELWVSNKKLTGISPSGNENIISTIDAGCGFLAFSGRGNIKFWATHPHDNFNKWVPTPKGRIASSDIETLSNRDKLPIVTVEGCSTAKFNEDTECFNWMFISNPNGGAIGTFGSTGLNYAYIGTNYIQGLLGKIVLDTYKTYKLDQATTFGELWAGGLTRYITSSMDEVDYKLVEAWQAFGDPTLMIGEKSQPPARPVTPTGPSSGKVGTEYTYTTSTTDPDGDDISYMFDWDDGSYSEWIGPVENGATVSANKTWNTKGTYQVKVVAKDSHGIASVWSDRTPVTMPYVYLPFQQLLGWLFFRFPNAFPFLRHLMGY